MNKPKILTGWLAALLVSFGAAHLPAQTPEQAPPNPAESTSQTDQAVQMSPFVISEANDTGYSASQTLIGSRSAKDLMDISGSIDIVSHEMLQDLNSLSFAQVIDYGTAGVTEFQNFQDDMMIRGFRSESMRNGVVNPGDQTPSPLYDVDRVEVIKGPAAMMLGTDNFLGGAVNYVPRSPTATPTGDVAGTINVDERGKSYERLVANTLGPLYKDQADNFSVLYRLTLGGITGDMDKAIESRKEYFAGGAFLMYFGKDTSLDVNFYYYVNDSFLYYDDFLNNAAFLAGRAELFSPYTNTFSAGLPSNSWENEHHSDLDATFLTKLTTNGNLRIFFSNYTTGVNESITRLISWQTDNVTANRQWGPYLEQATNDVLQVDYLHHLVTEGFTNDFYLGMDYTVFYEADSGFDISLPAVNVADTNPNYSGDAALIAAAAGDILSPLGYDSIERSNLFSDYVQDNVSFWNDRIVLVAGLRWFYERAIAEDPDYQYDGSGVYATPTDYPPLQVHKWGAVVKPLPWISLYWTNATNETPQSGFTNPASGPPVPYGNEVGELTEYGAKFKYKIGDKFNIYGSIAHFNMALTNVYTTDASGGLAPNGQIVTTVADDTSNGLELEYGMHLDVAGNGYIDLFATGYKADTLDAGFPPVQAPGSPSKVYSLITKYTWTNGFLKGLMIGGGGFGQGVRYELNVPIHTPNQYNIFTEYNIGKHWTVQLNMDNVTNQRYIVRIATAALVEGSLPAQVSFITRYKW